MSNRRWMLVAGSVAVLVVGCGGGTSAARVTPAGTASAAVQSFMRAVADSNLAAMASLWGSANGPAARTKQPSDYERRIAIMQSYLTSDDSRIVSDTPDGSPGRHAVQVQLRRQACTWTVPFSVIQTADGGWIINQVDLTAAGNPARPCDPSAQDSTPTARP